jgi:hypothetical protein
MISCGPRLRGRWGDGGPSTNTFEVLCGVTNNRMPGAYSPIESAEDVL